MKKSLVDVPVALIFFARPDCFRQVFEEVKNARPSKLFLIQDGARENRPDDVEGIKKCREIASQIDWECEVHTNYSEENLGCGKRVSSGITWAFTFVDRLIILEDDTVPNVSWFKFCEELLERYKNDNRVGMITGVNHLNGYHPNPETSYFFSRAGSIAGWATWKRVWDNFDYDCEFADHEEYLRLIEENVFPSRQGKFLTSQYRKFRQDFLSQKSTRRNSWSGPFGAQTILNSQLIIAPVENLITNVGLTPGATNGGTCKAILPKKTQAIFSAPRVELEFPLKHPRYVCADYTYSKRVVDSLVGWGRWGRFKHRIESYIRIILVRYLHILK